MMLLKEDKKLSLTPENLRENSLEMNQEQTLRNCH